MTTYPTLVDIKSATQETRIAWFEGILRSTQRSGVENVISFLRDRGDFYVEPASIQYHSNFNGGLLYHSLIVYSLAMRYRDVYTEMNPELSIQLDPVSLAISALLHDVCKCGLYKSCFRNKRDEDGNFAVRSTWEIDDSFPIGHGEKSVIILQSLGLSLSAEEMLAIRYHMGAWGDVNGNNSKSWETAVNKYPIVSLISLADFTASTTMEEIQKFN